METALKRQTQRWNRSTKFYSLQYNVYVCIYVYKHHHQPNQHYQYKNRLFTHSPIPIPNQIPIPPFQLPQFHPTTPFHQLTHSS